VRLLEGSRPPEIGLRLAGRTLAMAGHGLECSVPRISRDAGCPPSIVPGTPRGGTPLNSPRAGMQQGQVGSSRYAGCPRPPRCSPRPAWPAPRARPSTPASARGRESRPAGIRRPVPRVSGWR